MVRVTGQLDCFSAHIRLREPGKSEDKTEYANVATKEVKENRIGASPATRWQRPCMRVVVERGEEATSPVGLSYPKAKRRLEKRWTRRSSTVPQRRIYRSQRKGCKCKVMDSRAMSLTAPWYRRGGTSVESSIPFSHGGRALVIKGADEMENAKANFQYQDRPSSLVFSTTKRMGEVEYPSSLTYSAEELCISSLHLPPKPQPMATHSTIAATAFRSNAHCHLVSQPHRCGRCPPLHRHRLPLLPLAVVVLFLSSSSTPAACRYCQLLAPPLLPFLAIVGRFLSSTARDPLASLTSSSAAPSLPVAYVATAAVAIALLCFPLPSRITSAHLSSTSFVA
ncbi:hypothetical protein BHE74_00043424 [Ensete ventricosum]|nr:hypothetical protein BHE74_00043424 [Ensete ventricosum]